MPRYQLHVHLRGAEGSVEEFERWYEDVHLGEVLKTCDGFLTGQRFSLRHPAGETANNDHLAIYEVEASSADAVLAALNERRDERQMALETIDRSHVSMWVYEAAGDLRSATT